LNSFRKAKDSISRRFKSIFIADTFPQEGSKGEAF
jgi:hypothetical protein